MLLIGQIQVQKKKKEKKKREIEEKKSKEIDICWPSIVNIFYFRFFFLTSRWTQLDLQYTFKKIFLQQI